MRLLRLLVMLGIFGGVVAPLEAAESTVETPAVLQIRPVMVPWQAAHFDFIEAGGQQGPATLSPYIGSSGTTRGAITVPVPGLAAVSTDGVVLSNATAATVGTTAQISPRLKFCGSGYNSVSTLGETDCFIAEVLPVTNAGATTAQFNLSASINGGGYTNVFMVASGGQTNFAGNILVPSGSGLAITSRAAILASASKLIQLEDSGAATGAEFNLGTATLGTCTGGSITSGSHNFAGEVTGTTGGSCVINFGTPNFTNSPFCVLTDEGSTPTALQLSAKSASSITVANITSGHAFMYHCTGRIGT